ANSGASTITPNSHMELGIKITWEKWNDRQSITTQKMTKAPHETPTAGTIEARLLPITSSAVEIGEASSGSRVRRSFSPATDCELTRIGTNTGITRKRPKKSVSV